MAAFHVLVKARGKITRQLQGAGVLLDYVREVAENWPDHSLKTRDGKTYHFIEDALGSITKRIQARGYLLSELDIEWLQKNVHAAIVEVGSKYSPMVFGNPYDGLDAWLELHRLSGVTIRREDCERLGIEADFDDEE
jgi:hypothetical protein